MHDSDADLARRYRVVRGRRPADAAVTLLHMGVGESALVWGTDGGEPVVARMAVGTHELGRGPFRHDPPTALELENAIAAIEDAVMPLALRVPRASALVAAGGAIREMASAAGRAGAGAGDIVLAVDDVEHLFDQLAAVVQGRPAASSGVPAGASYAATLLIVRETMHHLGFASITITVTTTGA